MAGIGVFMSLQAEEETEKSRAGLRRRGCRCGAVDAPAGQLMLTSWTSNTTAWFGPIGDCGVLP